MDDQHPQVDYELRADGHDGERCEVCGAAPAVFRVRWWEHPRRGGVRPAEAVETHYFCAAHREQADRTAADLRARPPR
jgi:hypothetical protein